MELNLIGISNNGIKVYCHPESHSHRPDLNAETISKITLPENNTFFRNTVDMGRIIGKDHLVETKQGDTIFYLQRGNRPGESRMVIKDADDTTFVTVILCVCREEEGTPAELVGKWILVTLFEGKPGEREPFDHSFDNGKNPEGKLAAELFWENHALVPTAEELEQLIQKTTKYISTEYRFLRAWKHNIPDYEYSSRFHTIEREEEVLHKMKELRNRV